MQNPSIQNTCTSSIITTNPHDMHVLYKSIGKKNVCYNILLLSHHYDNQSILELRKARYLITYV